MIAKRLIRTVPRDTTPQVEEWWAQACALHPGWDHVTLRDPIDPDLFPNTSPWWERCGSGAQMAGLVRLEAVWAMSGVYLDSDVEVLRPLDALLEPAAWFAWEDAQTIPDFVFGAEAKHPVVGALMQEAVARVRRGEGAWASGPGVFTDLLSTRSDVLLLAPGAFAPIHYTEKMDADWSNLRTRFPFAYGAHHWHASWLSHG